MSMNDRTIVLVVDGAKKSAELQKSQLNNLDCEILTASGSETALKTLSDRDIDLILMSSAIPGKDAFSLIKHLSSSEETMAIPVIVVATAPEKAVKKRERAVGSDDFIGSPVDISALADTANALIRLKKCYDRIRRARTEKESEVAEQIKELNTALGKIEATAYESVQRLTAAAECRDDYTVSHILRMSHYAAAIARKMGLDEGSVENMLRAAPLHDIGKIGIPDRILRKPGKLNDREWEVMQRHTIIGGDILGGSKKDYFKMARDIALTHHEKWDGTGYPRGLAEENIPVSGRIAAVADVFDALISERPYKPPLTLRESFTVIRNERGTHFDPAVVAAFTGIKQEILSIVEQYKDGA